MWWVWASLPWSTRSSSWLPSRPSEPRSSKCTAVVCRSNADSTTTFPLLPLLQPTNDRLVMLRETKKERKIEKLFQTFQERRADLSENILNFLTPSLILTFLSLTNACRKWAAFLPLVTALGWEGHHVVTWPSLSPDLKYRCTTRCRGTSRDTCAAVIPCWENTWFLLQWGTGELAWKQNSSSSELVYLQTSLCLEMRTQLGCKLWLQQLEERQCCPHVEALVKSGGGGDETFSSCIQY